MASTGVLTLVMGVLCLFLGASSAVRFCSSDYELIQDDCFKLVGDKKTVLEATTYCQSESGTLASMSTLQMKEAVVDFVNKRAPGQYWTSGRDMGGRNFRWGDTDEAINPRFSGRIFGSDTCVYLCSHTRMFWDRQCDQSLGFICRKRPELDVTEVEAF